MVMIFFVDLQKAPIGSFSEVMERDQSCAAL
jgi:hypothetical protein